MLSDKYFVASIFSMQLSVGNLEYKGKMEEVVRGALRIYPLSDILTEQVYVAGEIIVPEISSEMRELVLEGVHTGIVTKHVDAKDVLQANTQYILENGRFLKVG